MASISVAEMPETNSHFDEKSGVVTCPTPWGRWYQTVAEVMVEVDLEKGTRAKEVLVTMVPNKISCTVRHKELFSVSAAQISYNSFSGVPRS